MGTNDFIAKAEISINSLVTKVWDALVNPEAIKKYMFGTNVVSDWKQGNIIIWKGEWEGRAYEDKGVILKIVPGEVLQYSHFSPMTGLPDKPDNYHIVTIELRPIGSETHISLTQNNNPTEKDRDHSVNNWKMMLEGLKKFVEGY